MASSTKNTVEVIVVSVESPLSFYIILGSFDADEKKYHRMVQHEARDASEPKEVQLNKVYNAISSQDNQWYRVRVNKVLDKDKFECTFIDYGRSFVFEKSMLRTCSLQQPSGNTIRCKLYGVDVLKQSQMDQANKMFKFLVSKRLCPVL